MNKPPTARERAESFGAFWKLSRDAINTLMEEFEMAEEYAEDAYRDSIVNRFSAEDHTIWIAEIIRDI